MRSFWPIHDTFSGDHCTQGHSRGNTFSSTNNIRFHSEVFNRPPFTGSAYPCLNFISDHENIISVTKFSKGREKTRRGYDITTFTLDWLKENSGNIISRNYSTENLFFNISDNSLSVIFPRFRLQDWMIRIRKWSMNDPAHHRIKTTMVRRFTCCKCYSTHRTSMESTKETNKFSSFSCISGKL